MDNITSLANTKTEVKMDNITSLANTKTEVKMDNITSLANTKTEVKMDNITSLANKTKTEVKMDNITSLANELQKGAIGTNLGGVVSSADYNKFISTVFDESSLLNKVQAIKGVNSTQVKIHTLGFASNILQAANEGTAPTSTVAATIAPRVMQLAEVILPFDITLNFFEENIEGENAEITIAELAGRAFRNDLLNLCVNGDTTSSDNFKKIINGWLKYAADEGHAVELATGSLSDVKAEFKKLLSALPNKYKGDSSQLVFLVSPDVEEAYRYQLSTRTSALGDAMVVEGRRSQYMGIDVVPVAYMPGGVNKKILLTPYQNLVVGFGRDMRVDKTFNARKRAIEYTITAKIGAQIADADAVVIGA